MDSDSDRDRMGRWWGSEWQEPNQRLERVEWRQFRVTEVGPSLGDGMRDMSRTENRREDEEEKKTRRGEDSE
jgi:hypothetical protein